ncbi:MAG: M48 family metallopeptidase [Capsulimonadales bacterium]|nr:M48 family metallopeptidase [Capsulimonadales bacterium]
MRNGPLSGRRRFAAGTIGLLIVSLPLTAPGCKRLPNIVSKSDEIKMGQQLAAQTEREYRVVETGPEADRLRRVAARLVPIARRDYDVPFSVQLLDSKEVNAFAAPGGPVYFFRGLVDLTTSDDELASVVGHELAHITKRHSARQLSDAYLKQAGATIFLGATRAGQGAATAAGIALNLQQLNYSRTDEDQSDEVGMKYMVEAGYNPFAMADMFRKLEKAGGGGGPEFLRSHPLTAKRITKAEERARQYRPAP